MITMVYSDDGKKIAEFYRERRILVPLSETPQMLIDAFVAAEDARFYKHTGIDFFSVIRAMFKNLEAGTIVQGGSTITQQVTKSFFLTPERSYTRKIKEAILSYRIDKKFSKNEILYLYLNQIYLGHGAYGIEAAAENYFGKTVQELNLAECAILAGLPQAPSKFSPLPFSGPGPQAADICIKPHAGRRIYHKHSGNRGHQYQTGYQTAEKLVHRGNALVYRTCPDGMWKRNTAKMRCMRRA